jgi:hypothetical protein
VRIVRTKWPRYWIVSNDSTGESNTHPLEVGVAGSLGPGLTVKKEDSRENFRNLMADISASWQRQHWVRVRLAPLRSGVAWASGPGLIKANGRNFS